MKTEAESHFAIVAQDRHRYGRTFERFDRIAFAMRALSILKPEHMRVAVYPRASDLRVERGRDLLAGDDRSIALVGIPPDASRQSIAVALADLAGIGQLPFMVDLLVLAGASAES